MIYVDLRGQRRPLLRADARARAHEPRREEPARRRDADAGPTPPASATCSGTPSRVRRCRCASCGRSRTGSFAISSMPCPASPKWPRSAGTCSSIRSTSIRTVSGPTTCRSAPWSAAVRDSNLNVGGNVLESNGAWLIVRGVGLIAVGRRRQAHRHRRVERRAGRMSSRSRRCRSAMHFAWPRWSRARTKPSVASWCARSGVNTKAVIDAVKARIAADSARPSRRRDNRAVLRPVGSDRAGRGHAAHARSSRRSRWSRWRTSSS